MIFSCFWFGTQNCFTSTEAVSIKNAFWSIHLFPCFLLGIVFVFLQTHQYNTGFKVTSERRGGKGAFVKSEWPSTFTCQFLYFISWRSDKQKQLDRQYFSFCNSSVFSSYNLMFSSTSLAFINYLRCIFQIRRFHNFMTYYYKLMEISRKTQKLTFSDLALLVESSSSWPWTWNRLKNQWLLRNYIKEMYNAFIGDDEYTVDQGLKYIHQHFSLIHLLPFFHINVFFFSGHWFQ